MRLVLGIVNLGGPNDIRGQKLHGVFCSNESQIQQTHLCGCV